MKNVQPELAREGLSVVCPKNIIKNPRTIQMAGTE